jgi:hypothetical protein
VKNQQLRLSVIPACLYSCLESLPRDIVQANCVQMFDSGCGKHIFLKEFFFCYEWFSVYFILFTVGSSLFSLSKMKREHTYIIHVKITN